MLARGWNISTDGVYGNQSQLVCRLFQGEHGLEVDGVVGEETWNAAWTEPVIESEVPTWPELYLSNYRANPHPGVEWSYPSEPRSFATSVWQNQMAIRGWNIGEIDGDYGSQSEAVCLAFQEEKDLEVDGIVGPETWAASWEAPIT